MYNIKMINNQSFCENFYRKIFYLEDYLFEKIHSLELSGIILNKDLVSTNQDSLSHANAYHAVWNRNLRELFYEAEKTGYVFENFLDIGSGKGKACFYAYKKGTFSNIIGVEFSLPIIEIANRNKEIIKSHNVNFLNSDASHFKLPDHTSLIFMFNPFDNFIMQSFLHNNIDHFQKYNSIIAYANDIHRNSITKFGFETIFRNQTRRISLYKLI